MRRPKTVHGASHCIAENEPDRLFCEVHAGANRFRLTYGSLAELSSRFAFAYRDLGVSSGDKLAVVLPHCVEQYPAYLAAMEIGAIPSFHTPFNSKSKPELYWAAQATLFDTVLPRLVVTDRRGVELIRKHLPRFDRAVLVVEDVCGNPAGGLAPVATGVCETCLIQYSSGTTGPRKGVALSHRAVLTQIAAYREALDLQGAHRIASWLPLYHDMGLITSFLMPLVSKIPVVALDPFEWVVRPTRILDAIVDFRATLCWLPNFAFTHIVNSVRPGDNWDLSTLRAIINCSEPCKGVTFDRFLAKFRSMGVRPETVQVCYAIAENVFAVTQTQIGRPPDVLSKVLPAFAETDILSSGTPVAGVEIRIVDPAGKDVESGEMGEIFVRSPFVIDRYFESDLSAVDRDGWYSTRDHGVMANGELFVIGRADDVIVTRGKNIFAHEVEDVLGTIPGLKPGRCAALGLYSEATETVELALVLETSVTGSDLKALRRLVAQSVEFRFGIAPSVVHFAPDGWLAKTSSGKISRSLNVQRLRETLGIREKVV